MGFTLPNRRMSPLAAVLLLSGIFFVLFLMISGALFLSRSPMGWGSGDRPPLFSKGGYVGVVEVKGVILDSKRVLRYLKDFADDERVEAVVMRLDSPGGAVAPSQEIYEAIKSYEKPVVASMASVAASGAFYIAVGADKVFANPGTLTGSIGVIMEFANLSKLYEWAKIDRYSVKTGRFKDVGADYRGMDPEERELLQRLIDNVLLQFKQAVIENRNLSMADLDKVADGRIFSGAQAKELQLIDELGTIQDAVSEAAKMAGIEGKAKMIYPDRFRGKWWYQLFLEDEDEELEETSSVEAVSRFLPGFAPVLRALKSDSALPIPGIYWIWSGAR